MIITKKINFFPYPEKIFSDKLRHGRRNRLGKMNTFAGEAQISLEKSEWNWLNVQRFLESV
jgi:hypothetical protein